MCALVCTSLLITQAYPKTTQSFGRIQINNLFLEKNTREKRKGRYKEDKQEEYDHHCTAYV